MPTGPKHYVIRRENGPSARWDEECRCTIGHDHTPNGVGVFDSDFDRWDREEGRGEYRYDPDD